MKSIFDTYLQCEECGCSYFKVEHYYGVIKNDTDNPWLTPLEIDESTKKEFYVCRDCGKSY